MMLHQLPLPFAPAPRAVAHQLALPFAPAPALMQWSARGRLLPPAPALDALYQAGRVDAVLDILERWAPDGPPVDELAAGV